LPVDDGLKSIHHHRSCELRGFASVSIAPVDRRGASAEGLDLSRVLKVSISLLGAFAVAFLAGFAVFVGHVSSYGAHGPVTGDAVVVLTGSDLRIKDGMRLFSGGTGRRLLISGVHHSVTRQDLQRLSDAAPQPLFNCCVDIGYVARDTIGNAAETRDWLDAWGFRRLVVVTSDFHMPRSLIELRRALPGVELVPYAVVKHDAANDHWLSHPGILRRIAVEYVKCWPAVARLALSRIVPGRMPATLPAAPPSEVSSRPPRVTGL
jgi:uncharacterized SAM-binding protein YcdF (DUF218 family)